VRASGRPGARTRSLKFQTSNPLAGYLSFPFGGGGICRSGQIPYKNKNHVSKIEASNLQETRNRSSVVVVHHRPRLWRSARSLTAEKSPSRPRHWNSLSARGRSTPTESSFLRFPLVFHTSSSPRPVRATCSTKYPTPLHISTRAISRLPPSYTATSLPLRRH
jgi:hypothetical protein